MDVCTNHPELTAVESCEVCQKPLCALCLWYTADGHRLCETHAQERELAGEAVLSPDTYREALAGSLRRKPAAPESGAQERTVYRGNSYDLASALAAVVGMRRYESGCGLTPCGNSGICSCCRTSATVRQRGCMKGRLIHEADRDLGRGMCAACCHC